jgi:hypothetical protein
MPSGLDPIVVPAIRAEPRQKGFIGKTEQSSLSLGMQGGSTAWTPAT